MKPSGHLLLVTLLAGCATAPTPHIYVLGTFTESLSGVRDDSGRRVIEVRPVLVPDHLDTTDILLRAGTNELVASKTGVWGERLSVGVTQALAGDLSRRLPSALVVYRPPVARPAVQVLVDISALQAREDGDCVLTAHWTIQRPRDGAPQTLASAQGSFSARSAGSGDGAVVAAITSTVEQLADQIAARIK